jgi:hypothetical protein
MYGTLVSMRRPHRRSLRTESENCWLTIRPPSPRVFPEVFILKTLKVDCFYRFTQVFILKDLIAPICTKIVQVS